MIATSGVAVRICGWEGGVGKNELVAGMPLPKNIARWPAYYIVLCIFHALTSELKLVWPWNNTNPTFRMTI